ncbi:hypothetical protein PV755_01250 [Streptomyces caniscabiei]|uniref:hypothetical protein n=1 Tax=Streptomyces caniscabiei TaxID=2746961 RepID=UPI001CE0F014|nr:hypothetical protein [Streptomyces caniscabiei]MDX3507562.1 hypothetical protein [Streptomyces caniscabiei]MDX3717524.1 hypothetical protein [Streptomyces caniscabiei]WEO25278.1 hypothetical protein IHE65_19990 [Streptomyces caniscabiei]
MRTRKITVIAASVGVAVAAATGVTYASSALESAPKSASAITDAAPAPRGGNGTGTNTGSNAATAPADAGAADSFNGPRKGNEGRGAGRGENRRDEGQIQVNERVYGAEPGSCIAVVNVRRGQGQGQGPGQRGAGSFNIRNDSDKTVEFFNGITCDNGAPVATVGPHSSSSAVEGDREGQFLVGSFRVVGNGHHW